VTACVYENASFSSSAIITPKFGNRTVDVGLRRQHVLQELLHQLLRQRPVQHQVLDRQVDVRRDLRLVARQVLVQLVHDLGHRLDRHQLQSLHVNVKFGNIIRSVLSNA